MKILVLNGPNLNLLNKRNSANYGNKTLEQISELMRNDFPDVEFKFLQSNIEGELVNEIQNADKNFDGLIINPGGYAHTSVAIHDALELCKLPKVEVHLSHLANREEFRQNLLTARKTNGYISGFAENSYLAAVFVLKKLIKGIN